MHAQPCDASCGGRQMSNSDASRAPGGSLLSHLLLRFCCEPGVIQRLNRQLLSGAHSHPTTGLQTLQTDQLVASP